MTQFIIIKNYHKILAFVVMPKFFLSRLVDSVRISRTGSSSQCQFGLIHSYFTGYFMSKCIHLERMETTYVWFTSLQPWVDCLTGTLQCAHSGSASPGGLHQCAGTSDVNADSGKSMFTWHCIQPSEIKRAFLMVLWVLLLTVASSLFTFWLQKVHD